MNNVAVNGQQTGQQSAQQAGRQIPNGGVASSAPQGVQPSAEAKGQQGASPVSGGPIGLRERIVMVMMVFVAVAAAAMAHVQYGFAIPLAALVGAGAWSLLLVLHGMMQKSSEAARLRREVARLEQELARLRTHGHLILGNSARSAQQAASAAAGPASGAGERIAWPPPKPGDEGSASRVDRGEDVQGPVAASAHEAEPSSSLSGTPSPAADPSPVAMRRAGADVSGQVSPQQTLRDADRGAAPRALQERGGEAAPTPGRAARPAVAANPARRAADIGWPVSRPDAGEGPAREAWDYEHKDTTDARAFAPAPRAATQQRPVQAPPMRNVEVDLELVQRKIKALADEVNANEAARLAGSEHGAGIDDSIAALRSTASAMKGPQPAYRSPVASEPASRPAMPPQTSVRSRVARGEHGPDAREAAHAGGASQAASASSGMGMPSLGGNTGLPGSLPSLEALIPASAQPIAVSPASASPRAYQGEAERRPAFDRDADFSAPPPPAPRATETAYTPPVQATHTPPAPSRQQEPAATAAPRSAPPNAHERKIAEIAAAIETQRMDVFLNPIVALGDYAVTHFEVQVRLIGAAGGYIEDPEASLSVTASDLLALFDIERLQRTAQVAEQLEARGKTGALLSPTAGHSMSDGAFLEAFARTFEERTTISSQLVLTFTQADVAAFSGATWQALADMHSFGFRFALEHVTHLSMDFNALVERGFGFVKLPAQAFLDGLPAGHGMVPPADICRHMAGAGLTLVVEAIDDDALLARVFGFGALFGQGQLFGGARQISLDALGPRQAA